MKNGRLSRTGIRRRKPKRVDPFGKARLNLKIQAELYYWIQDFALLNKMSVTDIIVRHFEQLKAVAEASDVRQL